MLTKTYMEGGHTFRPSQAKIPEEIENIVRLGTSVDTLADRFIHLLRVRKRTIAVPNNVEVAEMKIRREPDTAHGFILVDPGLIVAGRHSHYNS